MEAENLDDFKGLNQRNAWYAAIMAMVMFSMAGVPVFVGFFAKWLVIKAALDAGLVWLAIVAVVFSVVGAFYYLRIVYLMYFGAEDNQLDAGGISILWGFLVASAAAMVFGVVNLFGVEGAAAAEAYFACRNPVV